MLAINRRTRKRMARSATWIMRFDPLNCDRKSDGMEKSNGRFDVVVVNAGCSVNEEEYEYGGIWQILVSAAGLGKISAVVAGGYRGMDFNLREYRAKAHFLHSMTYECGWTGQEHQGLDGRVCLPCVLCGRCSWIWSSGLWLDGRRGLPTLCG